MDSGPSLQIRHSVATFPCHGLFRLSLRRHPVFIFAWLNYLKLVTGYQLWSRQPRLHWWCRFMTSLSNCLHIYITTISVWKLTPEGGRKLSVQVYYTCTGWTRGLEFTCMHSNSCPSLSYGRNIFPTDLAFVTFEFVACTTFHSFTTEGKCRD